MESKIHMEQPSLITQAVGKKIIEQYGDPINVVPPTDLLDADAL